MKHCIDCKYIGFDRVKHRTDDPETDSVCLHELSKRGEPSMVMRRQERTTCYNMRRSGACGLEAVLFVEKPKDKYKDDSETTQ